MPEIDHATAGVFNWKLCQHGFFWWFVIRSFSFSVFKSHYTHYTRYTHISLFVFSQWIFFSFWPVHQTLNRWISYEAKSNLQTIALNVGSHRTFANNFFFCAICWFSRRYRWTDDLLDHLQSANKAFTINFERMDIAKSTVMALKFRFSSIHMRKLVAIELADNIINWN